MWGGDMANQFNNSALSYANHQTATQLVGGSSLGDSANASYGNSNTFGQLEKWQTQLVDSSLGDSANASYGNSDTYRQNASVISSQSLEPLYHETLYGSAVYYGGPQSKYKLPGTVVGTEPWSNTNHFNQSLESYNKEVESSNITGAIQGDNSPNSITDHTHMGVQPLNSISCFEQAKLHFNNLIKLPLKEFITDPEKESSMKNALSILADNFTSFPIEIAEKIVELSVEFTVFVPNWRGYYSQFQKYSQQFSAEKENIVATSGENELRVRYEQLAKKEKELITELEAVKKEKAEIDKQEKVKEERFMKKAAEKLANLSAEWASFQSFFI